MYYVRSYWWDLATSKKQSEKGVYVCVSVNLEAHVNAGSQKHSDMDPEKTPIRSEDSKKHWRGEKHLWRLGWLLEGGRMHNRVLLGSFGPQKPPHQPCKWRIEECWLWMCGGTGNCGALQRSAPPVYTSALGLCSPEGLLKACQCSWPAVVYSHVLKKGRGWMAGASERK